MSVSFSHAFWPKNSCSLSDIKNENLSGIASSICEYLIVPSYLKWFL
jgi:hypothetical protein